MVQSFQKNGPKNNDDIYSNNELNYEADIWRARTAVATLSPWLISDFIFSLVFC